MFNLLPYFLIPQVLVEKFIQPSNCQLIKNKGDNVWKDIDNLLNKCRGAFCDDYVINLN